MPQVSLLRLGIRPHLDHAPNGNVSNSVDMYNGNGTYYYDMLNRLTASARANEPQFNGVAYATQCWGYDAFGNRTYELENQTAFGQALAT